MRVIVVDDEQPMLDEIAYLVSKYADIEIAGVFTQPLKAIEYMQVNAAGQSPVPDAIFMDIDLPQMNGLEAVLRIQELHPDIIVVFITAYSEYALESFHVHPLDYVLKPVKESRFEETVQYLRKQVQLLHGRDRDISPKVRINCFGHFQLSLSESAQPVKWGTRRVKELFMYLVNQRGAPSTYNELINAVFGGIDDKRTANNLYVTVYKLRQLISSLDPQGEYLRWHDDHALEISPGVCDYIDFINFGSENAVISSKNVTAADAALELCHSNYLEEVDYLWASQTASEVDVEYERIALGLAAAYSSTGNEREAERVLLALLARNPLSEEGYKALLEIYMQNDQPQDFKLFYLEYVRILKTEFGEKPLARYSRYYQAIRHN